VANQSKFTIRVTAARGSSKVEYRTTGRYISLLTGDVAGHMLRQPIFGTAGSKAFWDAILPLVAADIAAGNGGGT
jgi:hypothetical protein